MPRKSRMDAPGTLHHIMDRGIEGTKIFRDHTSSFPVCLLSFVSHRLGRTFLVYAGMFWNRNPTGDFTENDFILHGIQISPDKNVNFPCAAAPFTVSPVPWTLTCCTLKAKCCLAQGLGLIWRFCSSAHRFALRLPSDLTSRWRPCLRLVILLRFTTLHETLTGDLNPMSSRPCRAYTRRCSWPGPQQACWKVV